MRSDLIFPACVLACALLAQPAIAREPAPSSCPVTRPPNPAFVPPPPHEEKPAGQFWIGTKGLWTALPEDGVWSGITSPRGTRNKFWWWREGWKYDTDWRANDPGLIVTARRIDGDAPTVRVANATNAELATGWAMLLMLEIPSSGCWQITGNYRSEYVSMVVWVPNKPRDESQ